MLAYKKVGYLPLSLPSYMIYLLLRNGRIGATCLKRSLFDAGMFFRLLIKRFTKCETELSDDYERQI